MPKERNYNPVQAQRKADKKKEVKKGKAEVQARRNEKLAKKNPVRIQKHIDDLKKITSSGGKLTKHEESVLEGLERELKAVTKAREALGDKAPTFSQQRDRDGAGVLGKRRRNDYGSSDDSDVAEDVRNIPMPRDTPPPIPKEVMDAWYARRRARWQARNQARGDDQDGASSQSKQDQKPKPVVESKTVYESAPVVRDLKKEAVAAFVPTAVRLKMEKGKGQGGLLEPEEADRLEQQGYLKAGADAASKHVTVEEVEDEDE